MVEVARESSRVCIPFGARRRYATARAVMSEELDFGKKGTGAVVMSVLTISIPGPVPLR
jgi:hypothetical protein